MPALRRRPSFVGCSRVCWFSVTPPTQRCLAPEGVWVTEGGWGSLGEGRVRRNENTRACPGSPRPSPLTVSVLASGGQQRSPGGHAEQSWAVMLTP